MNWIDECHYREMMEHEVEPRLAALREDIHMPLPCGGTLHAEIYEPKDARRAVVISHGYTESAEKFREMTYYFLDAGFSVYAVDHRGHGQSFRQVEDTSITHIEHFHDYVDDLSLFIKTVVLPRTSGLPLCLYAHSMGGAIGALTLMEHPDWFARAVLTAPMIAASGGDYPRFVGAILSGFMCMIGKGRERAFIGKPFAENDESFEAGCDTSRARFDYYAQKRRNNVLLQNCSPSYSWIKEGLRVTRTLLNPENCKKIKTPLLLCQAGKDTLVLLPHQRRFVERVPGAKLRMFANAKHEIYGSDDATLKEYVPAVIGFLQGKDE